MRPMLQKTRKAKRAFRHLGCALLLPPFALSGCGLFPMPAETYVSVKGRLSSQQHEVDGYCILSIYGKTDGLLWDENYIRNNFETTLWTPPEARNYLLVIDCDGYSYQTDVTLDPGSDEAVDLGLVELSRSTPASE